MNTMHGTHEIESGNESRSKRKMHPSPFDLSPLSHLNPSLPLY